MPVTNTSQSPGIYEEGSEGTGADNNGSGWWRSPIVSDLDKIALSKLYLVVSLVIYGVIAFSKEKEGVNADDVASFIIFSSLNILLYFLIEWCSLAKSSWRDYGKSHVFKSFLILALIALFLWTTSAGGQLLYSIIKFF